MSDKISVVSVDDHYLIHEAIRSLLNDYTDIELLEVGSAGEHVIPLVEKYQPDVLILDLLMPQQEGSKVNRKKFSEFNNCGIIERCLKKSTTP